MSQSEKLRASQRLGPMPADLAFLAMAHFRLGQTAKAQDYLESLRERMRKPPWAKDAEAQGFARRPRHCFTQVAGEAWRVRPSTLHLPPSTRYPCCTARL